MPAVKMYATNRVLLPALRKETLVTTQFAINGAIVFKNSFSLSCGP